jgi:hypothetical protein
MTYYNNNVPFSTNNPSVDQPEILRNTQGISSLIAVDHVPFNTTNSGQHVQVTYNNVFSQTPTPTPPLPTDPIAIGYTANDSFGHPAELLATSQGRFMINCIRAFGTLTIPTVNTPVVSVGNQYNVMGAAFTVGPSILTVTLVANCINSSSNNSNTVVFASSSNLIGTNPLSYVLNVAGNIITFSFPDGLNGSKFNFAILQA